MGIDIVSVYNGRFLTLLVQEQIDYLRTMSQPDRAEVILPYSHVSQRGTGAAQNVNDCGPACIVSCGREHGYSDITVNEVAARYQRPNMPMRIDELRAGLGGYEMANGYERPLTTAMIAAHLREKHLPVIPLVSYRALPIRFDENYKLSHYIVIYGVLADGSFLYHDPLGDGRALIISAAQLVRALQRTADEGNLPNQGVLLV